MLQLLLYMFLRYWQSLLENLYISDIVFVVLYEVISVKG